ncbi:MAG: VCBS repeat-containing protein [Oscillospiraceae bacterium]|nr:VCBS repeat-containing protein [Oscillospiraceae bacterium]
MAKPIFEKMTIGELENNTGTSAMNTLGCAADINADGLLDYVVCGRNGEMAWFENTGKREKWIRHPIARIKSQECGGCAADLTGSGFFDIINGSDYSNDELCWWENTGNFEGGEWRRRTIAKTGKGQMHDTLTGEIKNDGAGYLAFTNQGGKTTVYCVPIPENPYISPWPGLEIIAEGLTLPNPAHTWDKSGMQPEEGLALGDVDNDGKLELVCGTSYYKWNGDQGGWNAVKFTDKNYITTKILIADIDHDGKNEIILAEGDAYIYGHDEGCKLAWFKPDGEKYGEEWTEHIIETGLLDIHSIAAANLCSEGFCDIFAGEIGAVARGGNSEKYIIRLPRLMVYENDGRGNFTTRHIIDEGTGTHEAALIDIDGDGRLDIIGKPLHGDEKWNIHVWYRKNEQVF